MSEMMGSCLLFLCCFCEGRQMVSMDKWYTIINETEKPSSCQERRKGRRNEVSKMWGDDDRWNL